MSAILPVLITWVQLYGYPVLWVTIFIAAIGLPLPISLMLLAAAAFAVVGDFNIFVLEIITVTASCCGDNVGYWIGKRWGGQLLDRIEKPGKHKWISPNSVSRSRLYFQRHGGWAVFFSRFLVSGLGGVINIVAGADRYTYKKFVLYDLFGEAIGAAIPLTLGYIFNASWETVGDILGAFSGFILALGIFLVLAWQCINILRRIRVRSKALKKGQAEEEARTVSETL